SIPNVEITGYIHQISVRANFTGANADRVHVDVYGDTMIWCSLGACSDINTDVIGRTLFF
ncbi:MAG TPA: hypothetical protein PLK06_00975, partial [bacterium]|nr:hypothetical protein [bacterium]